MIRSAAVLATSVLVVLQAAVPPQAAPYHDARLPIADRVKDLLGRMTLEEKFWQLYMSPGSLDDPSHDYSKGAFGLQISIARDGARPRATPAEIAQAHAERINAIQRFFVEKTRLGIPIIPFEEALHGLAREGATMFPQAIALAATWDTGLMTRVATAIAGETRTRGIRQVLSPVINIADDVRWGRVEETYGEDPYLSAEMGRVFIDAFESIRVITTPKHFVANVGEGGRDSYPIEHSERRLQERYFPPFEVAVREARARSVMTAYNSVDGQPATQNRRLLAGVLKGDWAFGGFVISDAAATGGATVLHMTEPNTPAAAKHAWESGLDVVFQSSYPQFRPYWDAVQRGLVSPAVIDAAVARVLRAKFEIGLFEEPYVDPVGAAARAGHADHRALALESARASIVLLKNDGVLPLGTGVKSVAVIGPDAVEARLGGYSGPGVAPVSILDGLKQRLGAGVAVRHAAGPGRERREYVVVPADALKVAGEYFDNNRLEGAPRLTRADQRIDFRWTLSSPGRGIPFDWYSVRWTGTVTAPPAGAARIGVEGNDGYRLYLDDALVIDNWRKQSYGAKLVPVAWRPGSSHTFRLEFFESTGIARVKLVWDAGLRVGAADAMIEEAVGLARSADIAIVVAGVEEGEFRDRAFLKLPGRQEELIQAVAATGKPVVVVLIGGSAITMSPWLDRVGAVLDAWYPGEQGGLAVADAITGRHNPSGRLPVTFPVFEGQLPLSYNHKPTGRGDDYVDLTGMALFPFGFGLSYTTFDYSALRIEPAAMPATGRATIRCRVKNTGTRAGHEVVQLYIRDVLASVARPVMELKGFKRIYLEPGAEEDVAFELGPRHLRFLDEHMKWIVEPGAIRILVGASSEDIRLRGELVVRQ